MKKRVIVAGLMVLIFVLFSSLASAQTRGGGHSGGGRHSVGHSYRSGSSHYSGWHGSWSHGHSFHGSGWGFRFYAYPSWGWPYPYAYPYYYPYPYPYYSSPPVVREEAPVYSEPEQEQPYYWYYCENPQGYYPYIKSCPGGWMKVVPNVTPPKQ